MDSGRGGVSVVCTRDVTEVVREALWRLRESAAQEKLSAVESEVRELRGRLERLRQKYPGMGGVEFSDDMRLLLQEAGRRGL